MANWMQTVRQVLWSTDTDSECLKQKKANTKTKYFSKFTGDDDS